MGGGGSDGFPGFLFLVADGSILVFLYAVSKDIKYLKDTVS